MENSRTQSNRKKSTKKVKIKRERKASQKLKSSLTWRVFGVEVHPDDQPSDSSEVNSAVSSALCQRLGTDQVSSIKVVRRSLDARNKLRVDGGTGPRFTYVLDVGFQDKQSFKEQPGRLERLDEPKKKVIAGNNLQGSGGKPTVVVVGAGPAGLFCALQLVRAGVKAIVLERGQPVESRGKDIGALIHRRHLNPESNFCYGEGGAGTWSDGKLTTRIGRNSEAVRSVLETFVEYGAPKNILVEGAPHLGTDNLVRLLRNMRIDLRKQGGEIRFGTHVTKLMIENGCVRGCQYQTSDVIERVTSGDQERHAAGETGEIKADAVVLATGHSARDMYKSLHDDGVALEAKGFAVGFRIEHPQRAINRIQYGNDWGPRVITGKKSTDDYNQEIFDEDIAAGSSCGHLPVPSYRLATDRAFDGNQTRGVYSFCMCPGGQIVPASTEIDELCVNGMSFSRRDSQWANSALVVTVAANDTVLEPYVAKHGVLAGIAFQREIERRAAVMGGGNFTVPVQRATDFINQVASTTVPSSSYRLGVEPSPCHELYPPSLYAALCDALSNHFEQKMPGYVCDDALLHGVETRTSSPVRILRNRETMQAMGTTGLFPAGEGAGFAGGIVSAAVDGMSVASGLLHFLGVVDEKQGTSASSIGSYY